MGEAVSEHKDYCASLAGYRCSCGALWTHEPPREAGWYWKRIQLVGTEAAWDDPEVQHIYPDSPVATQGPVSYRQWWPHPIQPPPTPEETT